MVRNLAKRKSPPFRIKSGLNFAGAKSPSPIGKKSIDDQPKKDERVGINLRYFQKDYECFSSWTKDELKSFSNLVIKIALRTHDQITTATQTCHSHLGKKLKQKLPSDISPEVGLYELDVTAKARMHGFFSHNTFYLIWLDREHRILKV
jgi:hypothetical protein